MIDDLWVLMRFTVERRRRSITDPRSGPGSPSGQPAWGGGCDRVVAITLNVTGPGLIEVIGSATYPVAAAPRFRD
jgi:hypothetical protein